jgi:hypothetical protein
MAATKVGSVSNIDIQRGTRRFGREQLEKNAPNVWFSGIEKNEENIDVLCRTLMFKNKTKQHYTPVSLVVVVTYKYVLQEDFDSGIPSIENVYLQNGNSKQQTMNRKATMALEPTHERGTTEAQFESRMQNPNPAN